MIETKVLEKILDHYDRDPANIISILQDIQTEANWLPEEDLRYVGVPTDITFGREFVLLGYDTLPETVPSGMMAPALWC